MDIEEKIIETKEGFEESFKNEEFYNRQTKDNSHLNLLIKMISPEDGDKILDLGTGSGYVAFQLAKHNHNISVIGIDIVEDTLERNKVKATKEDINNISFITYDGFNYPFENESIDVIVTRYALHHFPNIKCCFKEMMRVLKKGGRVIIADPTPNENDSVGFVDKYMKMKKDGHVKFYTFSEYKDMLQEVGFNFVEVKNTTIRFPRKNSEQYEELLQSTEKDIKEGYDIEIINDEIWITEKVLNMVFEKI